MQSRKLKKTVGSLISPEDTEELREAFELFDRKNTGKINISELKQAMQTLGFAERNPIIFNLVVDLEKKENTKKDGITFDTFIDAFNYNLGDYNSKEGIRKLFELFNDDPNAETISIETMRKIRNSLTETNIQNLDLDDIISRISSNGNKQEISFDDFYNYMIRKTYA